MFKNVHAFARAQSENFQPSLEIFQNKIKN